MSTAEDCLETRGCLVWVERFGCDGAIRADAAQTPPPPYKCARSVCAECEVLVYTYTCGVGVCGQPQARSVLLWIALGSWLAVRPLRTRARHDKGG